MAGGATSASPASCGGSGHEVYAPTLTGLGERAHLLSKDVDLDLHVRDVVELLFYEDLRDVILVGHSYGGMVITGVADRAADRIGRIVYLDAANPVNGQSLVDVAGPIIEATRPLGQVVDGVELVLLPAPGAGGLLRRDRPRATSRGWTSASPAIPGGASSSRSHLTNEDALWAIPRYHIVCTSTVGHARPRADGRGATVGLASGRSTRATT